MTDFTSVDIYWCEKCGFRFEWPHVKDHDPITHKLTVRLEMDRDRNHTLAGKKP